MRSCMVVRNRSFLFHIQYKPTENCNASEHSDIYQPHRQNVNTALKEPLVQNTLGTVTRIFFTEFFFITYVFEKRFWINVKEDYFILENDFVQLHREANVSAKRAAACLSVETFISFLYLQYRYSQFLVWHHSYKLYISL